MNIEKKINTTSRTAKILVDLGKAASFEEADKKLHEAKLVIEVGPDIADSATLQAALLTAVNTGRRCFLGGVQITGNLNVKLLIPWRQFHHLDKAVIDLKGIPTQRPEPGDVPRILIGNVSSCQNGYFAVRATFNGWSGGVIPVYENLRLAESQEFIPAGVLAGAVAVSEAFQFVQGLNSTAGHQSAGLSLWRPESGDSWLEGKDEGPVIDWLPKHLWIIGLGHLGQAFLWTLGLLPYAEPSKVELFLQDYDHLTQANESTSPLTFGHLIGEKKTRTMAQWCEERGFKTHIVERLFADNFHIDSHEPAVAFCGVDNTTGARSHLEEVGFDYILEAGLGKGKEYLAFQLHTFPSERTAKECWPLVSEKNSEKLTNLPAYQSLEKDGLDQCGITTLAGKTVGASFVGTTTTAIVIAELLRLGVEGQRYSIINGTLRSLKNRQAICASRPKRYFNPGLTEATLYNVKCKTAPVAKAKNLR